MQTYGRITLYANYTEDELNSASIEELKNIVVDILNNSVNFHDTNKTQTDYLFGYYKGIQDIQNKTKKTRDDINNKTVENWAYALVEFKKGWLLGKPTQYTLHGGKTNDEITTLNDYCTYQNKKAKDQLIYEDMLICGRGFRFIDIDSNPDSDSPFKIINLDANSCEVVYSSSPEHEQLLGYIHTSKEYIVSDKDGKEELRNYNEYTVYTRKCVLTVSDKDGSLQVIGEPKENGLNDHQIKEYYLNKQRISLIEILKDLLDDINYLESLDKDDMEQFVNAIMVFINAEVNEKDIKDIKSLGAVSIASTDQKQADIKLLEQRLNANTTNGYYSRLLNALFQIGGVPKASDNGQVSYGDTGQARLTGQGFTSAGIRATNDETIFEMCDLESLRCILKICKEKARSKIKKLKTIEIKINFQRDMSENLLVKTQALTNLYNAKVPREIVNAIIGLFPDPNIVTTMQEEIFGSENQPINTQNTNNNTQTPQEQNNELQNINEKTKQGV